MSRDECLPEGSRPSLSRSGARSGPWTDPWRRQVARPVPVESGARQASPVAGIAAGLGLTYGLAAMHRQSITDGTTTLTSATAVGVAVLCYLAAAATRTRWIAWVGVPVFSGVAFAGLLGFLPWWVLFVLAGVVLLVAGTAAGAGQAAATQAAAMLGFFGLAIVALHLAPRAGWPWLRWRSPPMRPGTSGPTGKTWSSPAPWRSSASALTSPSARSASPWPSWCDGCVVKAPHGFVGLVVSDLVVVPEAELEERFSHSAGPGGQGVNTADSRVELTFHLAGSVSIPEHLRKRMLERLRDRLVDGRITVAASEHRTQLANRRAARERLAEILRIAAAPPPPKRRPTKPTRGSQERRLQAKRSRAEIKRGRGRVTE